MDLDVIAFWQVLLAKATEALKHIEETWNVTSIINYYPDNHIITFQ